MNPFTESTVALPLAQARKQAANEHLLSEPQADSKEESPGQGAVPERRTRSDRLPLRSPRTARLARRRRSKEAGNRFTALLRTYGSKAAGAVLGLLMAFALPAAWAVDVNTASAQQLETVSGIGPKTAQVIIDERARGGRFESMDDLAERVKGIGPKKARSLQAAGLLVGQAGAAPKGVVATARKPGK